MRYLSLSILAALGLFLSPMAFGQFVTPGADQEFKCENKTRLSGLRTLLTKMHSFEKKYLNHKTLWPDGRLDDADGLKEYCASDQGMLDSGKIYREGDAVKSELEDYQKAQGATGQAQTCAERSKQALTDVKNMLLALTHMMDKCNP